MLLTQTPYNKNGALSFEDDYLVEHGYVQVIADVRGTGSSEGTWASFGPREQRDGYELAKWTRTQPWSDGTIGLHGTSYGAINQLLTAEQQPADPANPKLRRKSKAGIRSYFAGPLPSCASIRRPR